MLHAAGLRLEIEYAHTRNEFEAALHRGDFELIISDYSLPSYDGQLALAERTLQRAIAMDPNSYTAHHFLGQLYREMGRTDAAEREMKTAAQIQQLQAQNAGRNR